VSVELANAVAKRFIARPDVKAKQYPDGEYKPHRLDQKISESTIPWSRDAVLEHLAMSATYGHYFLDTDSTAKLFAFDIDLETECRMPDSEGFGHEPPWGTEEEFREWEANWPTRNPRYVWRLRNDPARNWLKTQFRAVAGQLANHIHRDIGVDCAVAYSGHKGIHVYGFTGRLPATDVVDAAQIVLDNMGGWQLQSGRASTHKHESYPHLAVEVYPKQTELSGGGFGNLMRLPLGKNLKSPGDPTFFVDLNAPLTELKPIDPLWALTTGASNPWSTQS